MKELEEKILNEGKVLPGGILKVASFFNVNIDSEFMMKMGAEMARLFRDCGVTKVLTVEASGIAFALAAAVNLGCPFAFAKKGNAANMTGDVYSASVHSFTHGTDYRIMIEKEYIKPDDTILIVDDFMAIGNASKGLVKIVSDAGASLAGVAIGIEKGFQGGGDALRKMGIRVESLANIESMDENGIVYRA